MMKKQLPAMKWLSVCMALVMIAACLCVQPMVANAAGTGTQSDPVVVEVFSSVGCYLMNTDLEAGDSDGLWFEFAADKDGILYVEVKCSADVDYAVDVYAGDYMGDVSDGNPIITYPVSAGDTITVHKYVKPDASGNIAKVSQFYVSAWIVDGTETTPVVLKGEKVSVPVTAGDEFYLIDNSMDACFCGRGMIVSGPADAMKNTSITIGSTTYTDVDCDGKIELATPGSYMARSTMKITNGSDKNVVYTFTAVDSAAESDPPAVPETIPGDFNADDDVNNDDVVYLLWHTLFADQYPISIEADFTTDGDVNNDDVVYLLWYTLFPDEYPL